MVSPKVIGPLQQLRFAQDSLTERVSGVLSLEVKSWGLLVPTLRGTLNILAYD